MILKTNIDQELRSLGHFAADDGPRSATLAVGDAEMVVRLQALDSMACEFEEIQLTSPRLADATFDQLMPMAKAIIDRLTYLYEPLAVIEADQEAHVIQLRSSVPSREDGRTCYFEVMLGSDGVSVKRYASVNKRRRVEPAQVTQQVLCRLTNDLLSVVQ